MNRSILKKNLSVSIYIALVLFGISVKYFFPDFIGGYLAGLCTGLFCSVLKTEKGGDNA